MPGSRVRFPPFPPILSNGKRRVCARIDSDPLTSHFPVSEVGDHQERGRSRQRHQQRHAAEVNLVRPRTPPPATAPTITSSTFVAFRRRPSPCTARLATHPKSPPTINHTNRFSCCLSSFDRPQPG